MSIQRYTIKNEGAVIIGTVRPIYRSLLLLRLRERLVAKNVVGPKSN